MDGGVFLTISSSKSVNETNFTKNTSKHRITSSPYNHKEEGIGGVIISGGEYLITNYSKQFFYRINQ